MEKYFLFFRAFGAIFPARRDLFGLAGVPHARGMPRAQDDGRKRRVRVRVLIVLPYTSFRACEESSEA